MPSFSFTAPNGSTATAPVAASTTVVSEKDIFKAIFGLKDKLSLQIDTLDDLEVFHGHKREGDKYVFKGETIDVQFRDYDDHLQTVKTTLNA